MTKLSPTVLFCHLKQRKKLIVNDKMKIVNREEHITWLY